jgi:hypothetical protein
MTGKLLTAMRSNEIKRAHSLGTMTDFEHEFDNSLGEDQQFRSSGSDPLG